MTNYRERFRLISHVGAKNKLGNFDAWFHRVLQTNCISLIVGLIGSLWLVKKYVLVQLRTRYKAANDVLGFFFWFEIEKKNPAGSNI